MGLFKILKRNSKLALRDNWGRAATILLIACGVSALLLILGQFALTVFVMRPMMDNPTMEPQDGGSAIGFFKDAFFSIPPAEWIIIGITFALTVLLIIPLSLGVTRWYYNLVHGNSMPVSGIFHYYENGKNYWRSIWYHINIGVRNCLWILLFYTVPSGILFASVYFLTGERDLPRAATAIATSGIFLAVIMFLLATLFYAACICRYSLVPFLLAEDDSLGVFKAIKTSIAYTKGYRFSMVWFDLSYLGWLMLIIFLFPIFYVWPYYSTGLAMYSRFIIEKNRFEAPDMTKEFSAPPESGTDSKLPD